MSSSIQEDQPLDAEQQRQEAVRQMIAEFGPDWADSYLPGTFGCHELLDRTILLAEMIDQSVLSHPACAQNREWYALAEKAVSALNDLYQKIGAAHLDDKNHCEEEPA